MNDTGFKIKIPRLHVHSDSAHINVSSYSLLVILPFPLNATQSSLFQHMMLVRKQFNQSGVAEAGVLSCCLFAGCGTEHDQLVMMVVDMT